MVHIVSDTSTLYSTRQAEEAGFAVSALSVTIADRTYREFDEISSEEFVEIIRRAICPPPASRLSARWQRCMTGIPAKKFSM